MGCLHEKHDGTKKQDETIFVLLFGAWNWKWFQIFPYQWKLLIKPLFLIQYLSLTHSFQFISPILFVKHECFLIFMIKQSKAFMKKQPPKTYLATCFSWVLRNALISMLRHNQDSWRLYCSEFMYRFFQDICKLWKNLFWSCCGWLLL